jgi:signal peptidase II
MKKTVIYTVAIMILMLADKAVKGFLLERGLAAVNPGAAFGIGIPGWLFVLLQIILVIGIIVLFIRSPKFRIIMAILLAGALGNLSDRLIWGGVVDYIRIGNFPVFNLSDLMITSALIFLVISQLGYEKTKTAGYNR